MKTTAILLSLVSAVALSSACEGPKPIPENPTWAEDVLPIIRGNCLGCHGAGPVCTKAGQTGCRPWPSRWDVFDTADFGLTEDELGEAGVTSAKDKVEDWLRSIEKGMPARMPPAPASPLEADQIAILKKFLAKPLKGKHDLNRAPFVRVVSRTFSDGKLKVVVDVVDRDDDQVLGKASAGGDSQAVVKSSGRQTLEFAGADKDATVTVTLSDGWAQTSMMVR
jgi:hypothetical protein